MQRKKSSSRKKRLRQTKTLVLSKEEITQQVIELLEKADEVIKENMELAQKFALQARKIQMRTRIKFPPQWKKRFCKHCKTFLYPGINCRVRLSSTNRVVTTKCFQCDKYTRIPYY